MSAFMLPTTHINAMVNAFEHYARLADRFYKQKINEQDAARMLIRENRASINHLHPDTVGDPSREPGPNEGVPETFKVAPLRRMPTRIEAWKLIDCYEYQACEHPTWEESKAAQYCRVFRRNLVESLPSFEAQSKEAPYVWEHE